MRRFFDFDGPLFTFLTRLFDIMWLNLLYIICCIPVVTIGAATTALYYTTLKMAKNEDGYNTRDFFKSFVLNLRQGTIIWVIFLAIIAIIGMDVKVVTGGNLQDFIGDGGVSKVVLGAVGITILLVSFILTYVFPILAKFDNTVKNTIKNAFLISIRHLPYTILFLIIEIVPCVLVYLSIVTGTFIGLALIFVMFSLVAYINSKYFNKIFVLYMPKEEVTVSEDSIFVDETRSTEQTEHNTSNND